MIIDPSEGLALLLVFVRASMFLFFLPMIGGHTVPVRVRVMFAMLLAVLLSGTITPYIDLPFNWGQFAFLVAKEVFVGGLLGFSIVMIFGVLQMGGHHIATEIGLMMSQNLNPMEAVQQTTVETVLFYFAALVFFSTGLHHQFLSVFLYSYKVAPATLTQGFTVNAPALIRESASLFFIGVQIAAPFIATIFLVNISFAVLGKVAPQVNVLMISFAVRVGLGLVLIILSIEIILQVILRVGDALPEVSLRNLVAP